MYEGDARQALMNIIYDSARFPCLESACRLGLFSFLEKSPGASAATIAAELSLPARGCKVLLLTCTAFELIAQDAGMYFNTPMTSLLANNPMGVPGASISFVRHATYKQFAWLAESLRMDTNMGLQTANGAAPGVSLYEYLAENPVQAAAFENLMVAFSRETLIDFVEAIDLSNCSSLLDIGGGTATNALALARRWPGLHVTIVDLPDVAVAAKREIARSEMSCRVDVVELDVTKGFPSGDFDCALFAHFIEILPPSRIVEAFRLARDALRVGGRVFVLAAAEWDDRSGPKHAAWMAAYLQAVASESGSVYTPTEIEQMLREAGFDVFDERAYVGHVDVLVSAVK